MKTMGKNKIHNKIKGEIKMKKVMNIECQYIK